MRVVLTGASHSGKSTLIQTLAEHGFVVIQESAIHVIEDLTAKYGMAGQRAWREEHPIDFQREIQRHQAQDEAHLNSDSLAFLDRGLIDPVAYLDSHGLPIPPDMLALASQARYDLVVLCDIVLPYEDRSDTGRTSNLQKSRLIESCICNWYHRFGYTPVKLAVEPPIARMNTLLTIVKEIEDSSS